MTESRTEQSVAKQGNDTTVAIATNLLRRSPLASLHFSVNKVTKNAEAAAILPNRATKEVTWMTSANGKQSGEGGGRRGLVEERRRRQRKFSHTAQSTPPTLVPQLHTLRFQRYRLFRFCMSAAGPHTSAIPHGHYTPAPDDTLSLAKAKTWDGSFSTLVKGKGQGQSEDSYMPDYYMPVLDSSNLQSDVTSKQHTSVKATQPTLPVALESGVRGLGLAWTLARPSPCTVTSTVPYSYYSGRCREPYPVTVALRAATQQP